MDVIFLSVNTKFQKDYRIRSLEEDMFKLLSQAPETGDVSFEFSDREIIKAHKFILSVRCDFFGSYFSGRWTYENCIKVPEEYSKEAFLLFLEYVYCGKFMSCENISNDLLRDIKSIGDLYCIGIVTK